MLPARRQLALDLSGRHSPSFDRFRAGANGAAVRAMASLTEVPAQHLLWGDSGCGKSHLLISACRKFAEQDRHSGYFSLDQFGPNDFDVLSNLDAVDLVCIDRLESRLGEPQWELALYHLISRRKAAGQALALAMRKHPKQISIGLKDLGSRLLWGTAFKLASPTDNEKTAILLEAARSRGLELSDDVLGHLMRNCPRNLGYLMPLLAHLDQTSLEDQRRLSIPFVKSALKSFKVPEL